MIKDKERALFDEWKRKQGYRYFISDGVLDEQEWERQKYRILFVLKEANWEKDNADLCEFLLSESSSSYWKTWNNVARWTKAILEGGEYNRKVSNADKSYWLRKVAVMNLKKEGGGAVADNNAIYTSAMQDKSYIKRQIQLYEPDIIICCGQGKGKIADILHDVVFATDEVSEWKDPILQYNYFFAALNDRINIPVVSFYHPQMRGGHELFLERYEDMKFLARELKNM